ncbi:alkaline phosphatase family protein [Paenibacillus wynnii]|uniref:alkaline phosphatase family protein n=1 Tax=Paenibacillus wynnii TaxID=268407 RepID=UPI00278DB459|nr:alkaline phosphatase family protein [Paenibacillus wynnii]MDQ0194822.1 putative AlkP superfamily pyrophosphatase or phosphodiesterase [Paenibacillus wynnii]
MRKKGNRILPAIFTLILICGCQNQKPREQDLLQIKSANGENRKKVILLVADSLMSQAIDQGIKEQKLPAFQFLIQHGQYYKDLVSSFPTMSVTIDSSLLTGKYPDVHHVPGLTWYSAENKKIINYGTGPMEVLRHGISPVLANALIHLNGSHLNPNLPTIYEDLARHGLKSGSINGLIYRGASDHTLSIPEWIQGPTTLPKKLQVKGPDLLSLGSLSNPFEGIENLRDGPTNRLGINNSFALEAVKYLIKAKKLPDFLYVYLPDLDKKLHKKGPTEMNGVKELDKQLQALLQTFGSPEKAIKDAIIIIVGDSGMTKVLPAGQNPVIDLPSMLGADRVLRPGENVSKETEIILAVNETLAYVYTLKADRSLKDVANVLKKDPRIDFIAWKEKEWIYAIQGSTAKQLKYKASGNLTDSYKQSWTVEQDSEVLDIKVNAAAHLLDYGQYPDVLQRLSGALHSHQGKFLVVTAKPGYELVDRSSPTHINGGAHGSIRKTESLVPLIISGTNQKPKYLRIVDLKAYLLDLLTMKAQ